MELIKTFKEITKSDTAIAGGKGASLGEMTQAGIPVPDGFVILSNAFERFIKETDLNVEIDAVLDEVDIKEVHTAENASEKIQAMILSKEMPEDIKKEILKFYKNLDCKFVAVRSSATSEDSASATWAGQLDSFLNTTKKTLLENVKKCWASLFTPRAIFYRFEKKLNKDKISVAVVVQKMVDSEESGVAFSVHPVTQDENQIIIEAGFGLGEAIVSGSITPDSYVVDKRGFKILDINVNEQTKALYKKSKGSNEWKELNEKGKKQVLAEKEITELSKLIVKIENHYGFPCDIEWAKEKGKFYIVQSRPITTLSSSRSPFKLKKETINYASNLDSEKNWNLKDLMDWKKYANPFILERQGRFFHVASYLDALNLCLSNYKLPASGVICKDGRGAQIIGAIDKTIYWFASPSNQYFLGEKLIKLWGKNPSYYYELNLKQEVLSEEIDKHLELFLNNENKMLGNPISIFNKTKDLMTQVLEIALITMIADTYLNSKISEIIENNEEKNIIASGTTIGFINLEEVALLKIALIKNKKLFNRCIKTHAKKYFFIENNFWEARVLKERFFINRVLEFKKNYGKDIQNQINKKIISLTEMNIKRCQLIDHYRKRDIRIVNILKYMDGLAQIRDFSKEYQMKLFAIFEILLNSMGKKINLPKDLLLFAFPQEIKQIIKNPEYWRSILMRRKTGIIVFWIEDREKNTLLDSTKARNMLIEIIKEEAVESFKGQVATKGGTIIGKIKIVMNPRGVKFNKNTILVTDMTTPDFVPIMKKSKAIITNIGGITCHAAIISRELGIPCVIGTKIATKVLKDNDIVEIDTNIGVVKILKKTKS